MIRTFRNLSALAFLLTVLAFPGTGVQAQGDHCAWILYRCNGENIDFGGCVQDCGDLWARCSAWCDPGGVHEFYCEGNPGSTSGYCDCEEPCFEG